MKVRCFWCEQEFTPGIANYVHVGGHGEVYGCDKCLELTVCDNCLELMPNNEKGPGGEPGPTKEGKMD